MTDRPILFSGPMVRALIEGRKTQTRRLVAGVPDMPPANCHPSHKAKHATPYLDAYCGERKTPSNPRGMGRDWHWWQVDDRPGPTAFRLPYATGDRLYVREAWRCNGWATDVATVFYRASEGKGYTAMCEQWPIADKKPLPVSMAWRPSIHMPRWASRMTLAVTDVRVQRLNEISEADAIEEGIMKFGDGVFDYHEHAEIRFKTAKGAFKELWNNINGPDAWDADPWVVALTFDVQHCNIDEAKP